MIGLAKRLLCQVQHAIVPVVRIFGRKSRTEHIAIDDAVGSIDTGMGCCFSGTALVAEWGLPEAGQSFSVDTLDGECQRIEVFVDHRNSE